jgi:cation diffusion facilitator CzcD-associated flavoprotein CzcO
MIVGGGESAADITYQISSRAKNSAISIRHRCGHIVFAYNSMGQPSDLDTFVFTYSDLQVEFVFFVAQLILIFLLLLVRGSKLTC